MFVYRAGFTNLSAGFFRQFFQFFIKKNFKWIIEKCYIYNISTTLS